MLKQDDNNSWVPNAFRPYSELAISNRADRSKLIGGGGGLLSRHSVKYRTTSKERPYFDYN